jgi:hypothetical protein
MLQWKIRKLESCTKNGEKRDVYPILVGKPEGMGHLGKSRRKDKIGTGGGRSLENSSSIILWKAT